MSRADYNPRIDGERSFRVWARAERLKLVAAHPEKARKDDPEEMKVARTGVFDPKSMRPLYE